MKYKGEWAGTIQLTTFAFGVRRVAQLGPIINILSVKTIRSRGGERMACHVGPFYH